MRQILVTLLLIMTVVVVYNETTAGEKGTKGKVKEGGAAVNRTIQSINP
ncbi:hypothetical protein MJA45_05165 [Paenibacillus aurantius]|uniref:Uncharacterized protein n=1 Tax=Paenibacillus aurantius TaxID=2918900 RepID=A0AA96LFR6_9BACL|nr:hypothetical protein [Paenibacillus aurantius]WJH37127.1 hypothetical protein N6H14_16505 [Paenibacillus sp. CC-CFT747]WNQ12443.1 hypothetical protein MJA45_05165 [Paenibacillus aurantius]